MFGRRPLILLIGATLFSVALVVGALVSKSIGLVDLMPTPEPKGFVLEGSSFNAGSGGNFEVRPDEDPLTLTFVESSPAPPTELLVRVALASLQILVDPHEELGGPLRAAQNSQEVNEVLRKGIRGKEAENRALREERNMLEEALAMTEKISEGRKNIIDTMYAQVTLLKPFLKTSPTTDEEGIGKEAKDQSSGTSTPDNWERSS